MSVLLPGFSLFAWSSKEKEPSLPNGSSSSSSDVLKFPVLNEKKKKKMTSSSRKARQRSREQRIDKEFDVVLVPSDGVCLSESDSDDSDWSIGWLEPHDPNFQSDDESKEEDNSFGVLVPCYHPKSKEMNKECNLHLLNVFEKLQQHLFSSDGDTKYIEHWLSNPFQLQKMDE